MAGWKSHTPLRRPNSPETSEETGSGIGGIGKSFVQEAANSLSKFGGDFFDQIFGTDGGNSGERLQNQEQNQPQEVPFRPISRERITVFSLREQREQKEIQQIKELLKQIKEEIQAIKKADAALAEELKDAEKLTMEVDPKAGVYHIRFLEMVLKLLHNARAKIGESSAWLNAMRGKPKRGSAFAARSKKAGTQYSQSQELSTTRSVQ